MRERISQTLGRGRRELTRLQLFAVRVQRAQVRLLGKQVVAALTLQRITVKVAAGSIERALDRRVERLRAQLRGEG
jgi:hypothetical protein